MWIFSHHTLKGDPLVDLWVIRTVAPCARQRPLFDLANIFWIRALYLGS